MGSAQSSSVKQTVEVLNKSVTNMVTTNTNIASARNSNANSFTVKIGEKGDISDCNFKFGQKINAKQAVKVMAKFQSEADLQTKMKTALKNSVDQSSSSTQAALATSLNCQNSKQEINQKVSNLVETNIKNETLNQVNGFLDNLNNGTLEILGKWSCAKSGGVIEINQDIVSDQLVELLSDALIGNKITNETDTSASADSKQKQKSDQKGVIDALGGLMTGPLMIIALIIVVGIIGVFIFRKSISKIAESKAGVSFGKRFGLQFGKKRLRMRR